MHLVATSAASTALRFRICRALRIPAAGRALSYSAPLRLGWAFDIDGVLKLGSTVLPEGRRVMKLLEQRGDPFVFVTNSGGTNEKERTARLSEEFGVELSTEQLVLSHTPMQSLSKLYGDKPVLVVGGPEEPVGNTRNVMKQYGFSRVYTTYDLQGYAPASYPFGSISEEQARECLGHDFSSLHLAAVIVFHDSRDWGRDIQLIVDVLRAREGVFGTVMTREELGARPQLPLYFSHADLLWGNSHPVARFGQGAFRAALDNVWLQLTGQHLRATTFGKPQRLTYEYADALLDAQAVRKGKRRGDTWMLGDNPASDIAGANAFGWRSALVRTGVYRDADGPPAHVPDMIVDDVEVAVLKAIELEERGRQ